MGNWKKLCLSSLYIDLYFVVGTHLCLWISFFCLYGTLNAHHTEIVLAHWLRSIPSQPKKTLNVIFEWMMFYLPNNANIVSFFGFVSQTLTIIIHGNAGTAKDIQHVSTVQYDNGHMVVVFRLNIYRQFGAISLFGLPSWSCGFVH